MADKLPAPVQYNRPPTKARPQDPRRFETHTVLSAGSQQDPEYQKMVQDIEALQQRQGYVRGQGAFDRDDLLYLTRKQEEERLREQEQRDSEAAAFAAARARAAVKEQAATAASLKQSLKQMNKQQQKAGAVLQPLVKVKPQSKEARSLHQHQQEQLAGKPEAKRPRLEATTAQGREPDSSLQATAPVTVAKAALVHALKAESGPGALNQESGQQEAGLGALLGGYGSDGDDSDSDGDQPDPAAQVAQQAEQAHGNGRLQLPSATELLEQELPTNGFATAHQRQIAALARTGTDSEEGGSSDKPPAYQQQAKWI